MARIRSIKPGYFTSLDTAGALTRDCRLHFAGLWTYADDHGRGVDEPRLIKAAVWPLDDDINADEIEELQAELEAAGRIIRYEDRNNGRRYFQVVNWYSHQKPNRPQDSSHPPPEDEQCVITEGSVNAHGTNTEDASPEGRGEEGSGEVHTPSTDVDPVEDSFEQFWDIYPKRNGKKVGKTNALIEWRKLSLDERRRAYIGARNLAASDTMPKDPERFLRRGKGGKGDYPFDDWQESSSPQGVKPPRQDPVAAEMGPGWR